MHMSRVDCTDYDDVLTSWPAYMPVWRPVRCRTHNRLLREGLRRLRCCTGFSLSNSGSFAAAKPTHHEPWRRCHNRHPQVMTAAGQLQTEHRLFTSNRPIERVCTRFIGSYAVRAVIHNRSVRTSGNRDSYYPVGPASRP